MNNNERAIEMTHHCVRNNTILEDIHAGKSLPDKYMEGYSRITDEEMKQLMQEIISNIHSLHFLTLEAFVTLLAITLANI